MLTSAEIRRQFIEYFEQHTHTFVPSSPVVPKSDPTLLFANAGMNQFKDVFLGHGSRPYSRAVNAQKCLRVSGKHNDLEEVGVDTYHHTFFEMLGNWSFGDYYKREAIQWAWELLTGVWKLPKEKLYATVYVDDDEAEQLWKEVTDIDHSHISRWGKKDNFWEMGDVGPCGPCSEIHIDRGIEFDADPNAGVNTGSERYIELWNLVFIQYNRDDQGELHPLPAKHVDTGMGFERVCSVLQGVGSNYSTDVFQPILQKVAELSGVCYENGVNGIPHRVLADHVRAVSFAITDGALPGNEGRGYVLRRLIRRAARFARKLHITEPILNELVSVLDATMGDFYPELRARKDHVIRVIRAEEQNFSRTLDNGIERFESEAAKLQTGDILAGEIAWQLYDTYGFPLDLTQLMAREAGLGVDIDGFNRLLNEQRERGRAASKIVHKQAGSGEWTILTEGESKFIGFDKLKNDTSTLRWRLVKGEESEADSLEIVIAETPFYPEGGGQLADYGTISGKDFSADVFDVRKSEVGIIHRCRLLEWSETVPELVECKVDEARRVDLARNHTATHLLNQALRVFVGGHVHQAGSLVHPEYLRFDFTHFEKVSTEKIVAIEQWVNDRIHENGVVVPSEEAMADLKKEIEAGKIEAMFDEKYGDTVRIIRVRDKDTNQIVSQELCGGTHVTKTAEIGTFIITTETGAAAGVRRIEALTGRSAYAFIRNRANQFTRMQELLASAGSDIVEKLTKTIEEKRQLEKAY
ncbi:MAG: alanine--tRNA ligase, partial [bacterium]|nr:alanine--tRNA ligase [bacterium]